MVFPAPIAAITFISGECTQYNRCMHVVGMCCPIGKL